MVETEFRDVHGEQLGSLFWYGTRLRVLFIRVVLNSTRGLWVSPRRLREIGKRSSCLAILNCALWPALFMPYVRAIPHFRRPLSLYAPHPSQISDGWLYVSLATVPIRSCAYKQTQRMQKIVRRADAWKEYVPFLHFLLILTKQSTTLTIHLFFKNNRSPCCS